MTYSSSSSPSSLSGIGWTRSGRRRNCSNVSFGLSESSKLLDQARTLAFADAKRRAALYAQAAGLQLGRAISIHEDAGAQPRTYRAAQAVAASSTPIEPGEETLRVGVTVAFELLN